MTSPTLPGRPIPSIPDTTMTGALRTERLRRRECPPPTPPRHRARRTLLVAVAGAAIAAAAGTPTPARAQLDFLESIASDIRVRNASLNYDPEANAVTWTGTGSGPLSLDYEGVEIFADSVSFDIDRELIIARGDVSVYKDGLLYKGDNIRYDIRSEELSATALRTAVEPVYLDAGDFETRTRDITVLETENTWFTTHDSVDPNFRIKAKTVDIYPDDRIVFRNLTAYAGKIPVFYFPYLSQPLDEELGYTFMPGYADSWGAYLLNRYGTLIGDHSIAQFHLDFRSERGVAAGIDLKSRRLRDNPNLGNFKFYYAYDTNPDTSSIGSSTKRIENVPDESRYRLNLQHRIYLPGPEESTFYLDFDLNKLSDEFFYEDFFPGEFRIDPRPDNIVNLVKTHERGTLSLLGRFQVNDFFQTDTRLPELALDFTRQPFFNTRLFYDGVTSFGIYNEELADVDDRRTRDRIRALEEQIRLRERDPEFAALDTGFNELETFEELDRLRARIEDRGFTRFHTYHELLYPKVYGGWLSLTPRVGAGFQGYWSVDGPGDPGNETRGLLSAGLDVSTKISKVFPEVRSEMLGVEGIRHVFQPYGNYSYLHADELDELYPRVDRLVPTTRLRPLDVPQFTAIDDLQTWNIFRLGMRNTLFTRRNDNNYNWMGLNTYVDVFFDDPEFDRDLSNLFNDFYWRPLPWMRLNIDSQVPFGGGDYEFTELNSRLTFQPIRSWEFSIGHQFLQDHPFFEDSSLITFRTYARLSENWGFGMVQRFEMDDSTLEIQQYSLHRDLTSWTASIGALIRDNRDDQEFGIIFALTLKEFPQVAIPLSFDPGGGS